MCCLTPSRQRRRYGAEMTRPADAPECREQDPIPDADACDESLDQWLSKAHLAIEDRLRTQPPTKRHMLMRDLTHCLQRAVLHEVATSRLATGGH